VNSLLSSISCQMRAMLERQSQKTSWTIECAHQCIDQNWNILFQFSDVTKRSNLPASELNFWGKSHLGGRI
jgi:hypothetical protein